MKRHTEDVISVDKLILILSVSDPGRQPEVRAQPIRLSLSIYYDITEAARADDLNYSVNYASICSTLESWLPKVQYPSLEDLVASSLDYIFGHHAEVQKASIIVSQTNSLLQPARVECKATRTRSGKKETPDEFILEGLKCMTLIGVNPYERTHEQPLFLDIAVRQRRERRQGEPFPFCDLSASISHHSDSSRFGTLEAFALSVARHVAMEFTQHADDEVTLRVAKPMALPHAKSACISITRKREDFVVTPACLPSPDSVSLGRASLQQLLHSEGNATGRSRSASTTHTVAIALGSNLGDRFANMETALRLLEAPQALLEGSDDGAQVTVVNTSFMYETAPMYVTDQPRFANCACIVETNLQPVALLRLLKKIEDVVGRVPTIRNGPRAIDLDILTYDHEKIDTRPEDKRHDLQNLTGELVVPHPQMTEREFVLRPLNDMIPDFVHPVHGKTIRMLLSDILSAQRIDEPPMLKVLPFPKYPFAATPTPYGFPSVPPTAKYWIISSTDSTGKPGPHITHIMATLNVTPDSFSDGSMYNTVPAALEYVRTSVESGAHIIDVGGCSTRPGTTLASENEERDRVLPIISAIRAQEREDVANALISIDTFRWKVAEAAVQAGANCINDVHAFTGPDYPLVQASAEHLLKMREVARRLSVPVVLMHSRGDVRSNKDYSPYEGDLVRAIQSELGDKVEAIVRGAGGVRRWLVIVDPGFGFSKPVDAQYTLLRHAASITADKPGNRLVGYPLLIGTSKKSFLGSLLQRPDSLGTYKGRKTSPQERVWATAATVACTVQQGANVVRVHDVPQMRDVVATSSAIWSGPDS
ncbi:Dihydropteroate synthase-like protein [Pisolithus marmoratus]|nr:Dihydropteroate synthase-like protein [Pisolithus marmoratus]